MLFTSTSVSLANAEFDSMGDIVEGGVGIPNKTSPRRTAIQKVQVELRQECDFRDERRRELEFLENGGNPLDFKLENVSSVSVQSTSCTDQHPDLFETSEAKVSFACTTLPHGDSAESSGRPGTPHGEASSADNLMLFAIEREVSGSDRSSLHLSNSHVVPSEQSFQTDVSHKTMEPGDSAAFDLPGKAYKRRYRSHTSRDGTRSSSTDVNPTCGSLNSSLPFCHGPRDITEFVADSKYQHPTSDCNSESVNPIGDIQTKMVLTEGQRDTEFNYVKAVELDKDLVERVSIDPASCTMAFGNPLNDQHNQQSLSVAIETPKRIGSKQPEVIQPMEEITSGVIECQPSITFVNQSSSCQLNDFGKTERDEITDDSHNITSRTTNGMGSDLPCTQNNPCADGKTEKEICRMRKFDSNGNLKNQTLDVAPVVESDGVAVVESEEVATEKKKTKNLGSSALFVEKTIFACQSQQNGIALQPQEELNQNGSTLKNEARNQFNSEDREASRINGSESGRRPAVPKFGSGNDEDSILKEAKIIEEKRKRILELLIEPFPVDIHVKSKWDFVLEEMAWMANDFAQERIWKIAAASELCYRATFSSRLRKQEKISGMEAKKVAHTLSKAVIGFWHSVKESSKELDDQQSQKTGAFSVLAYAVRFLKYNTLNVLHNRAEFPPTPGRTSDLRTLDISWEENLTEENLFYTIPPGAIEMYKKSIESHVAQCKRIGASAPEEVETSACDTAADFAFQENMYEDDEEEMSTYDMAVAYDNNKPARFCQNKRKQLTHAYGARSFDVDSSLLAVRYTDNKVLRQPSSLMVKRPCSSLNVSIPTKRVRTAYRRVMSPFSAGTSGCMVRPNKTEASSGDTSSFQDDHSTLHGVSLVPNSLESELGGEFGKQLPLDSVEVSTKSKKRSKHLLQRVHWKNESDSYQLESNGAEGFLVQPMMKMLKMQQLHDSSFDDILPVGGSVTSPVASQMSNMSNSNKIIKVIVAHDRGRKPKAMKMPAVQPGSGSPWSLFEDQALVVLVHDLGPNWELISDAISGTLHFKCIFRKPKVCKERHQILMDGTSGDGVDSAEDSGSSQPYRSTLPGIPKGSARQLFQRLQEPMEEDTLNSHFDKIITIGQKQHYRKTQEPKQLLQPHNSHTILLSQVSPNNLSGGPVLTPLDFYDATIVGSDMLAVGNQGQLSSVLTNPNPGSVAPMLSASGASSTFHGSSTTMLGNSLQSSPGSLNSTVRDSRYGVPRSASISIDEQQRMQQYSQVISGRNSSQHNTFAPGTLPVTDRVRILSGGNGMGMVSGINKSMPTARPGFQGIVSSSNSGSMLSPVVASANVHSVVGSGQGSSLLRPREPLHMMRPGMVQGSQRQMMVPDIQMQLSPGSQGMPQFGGLSSPSPNQTTSSQLSSYSLYNQQSHPVSPQQPQVISPNTHFQASARPNVQQHAYAIHLAKERQTRQRLLQQQPQQLQLVASNSLVPHVHSSPQLPISSPVQTSPQVQPEMSSPPVSLSPLTSTSSTNSIPQQQQKQHTHTQGGGGNAQTGGIGLTNQISKQRQQQQLFSLANRQHPQQRQLRQQAKVLSGVGRGNPILHQIVPIDQSQLNGFSTNLGNECLEKGEPATPLVQSQGLCTGSTQNSGQPPRQYTSSQSSNQSLPQKKECSGRAAASPKHPHQMTYLSDTNSQGHVSAVAPTSLPSVQQSISSFAVAGLNHQQVLPPRKSVNQIKSALQRVSQPICSINSEPLVKPQANEFDTGKHQSSGPSEMDRLAKMESNAVNSETNLSSLVSAVTNSSEAVPQAGQGLCQRPSASLPPLRHDVSAHWHQRPSHVQQYQRPVAQTQHPPLQRQQQQPLLPLHSQLQTQLHQTVKNNLYGSPGDNRI